MCQAVQFVFFSLVLLFTWITPPPPSKVKDVISEPISDTQKNTETKSNAGSFLFENVWLIFWGFSPVDKGELCGLSLFWELLNWSSLLALRKHQISSPTSKATSPKGLADGRTEFAIIVLYLVESVLPPWLLMSFTYLDTLAFVVEKRK